MARLLIATEYTSGTQNSTGYLWSKTIDKCIEVGLNPELITTSSLVAYESFSGNTSLIKKLFKQFRVGTSLAFKVLQRSSHDSVVFTGTNPVALLCLIPVLICLRRSRWVLLVHDVFPENLIAAGLVKESSPHYRILKNIFDRIYSSADLLICIGRDVKRVVDLKTRKPDSSVYIPNWVDENEVYPRVKDCTTLGIPEVQIVFQFFGNIGRVQGIHTILSAISLVQSPLASFLFFGAGALLPELYEFIASHPASNIVYGGHIPLEDKNRALSMCDVALVSLDPKMLGLGVPSKAYFSLASGRPVLAAVDSQSEIGYLLTEHPVGWRCDPGDPKQLASLIDYICAHPEAIKAQTPRSVFLKHYSQSVVLDKLVSVLYSVLSCSR